MHKYSHIPTLPGYTYSLNDKGTASMEITITASVLMITRCAYIRTSVAGRADCCRAYTGQGKIMGIVCMYLVEILLELTLGPTIILALLNHD